MMRKQALITGAASGPGLEFCRLLAADSYDLVMVDKNGDGLGQAALSIRDVNGTMLPAG